MTARRTPNLRQRLLAGACGLGGLAILAAFLAAYGVRQALWLGEEAATAQRRMDALAGLSARITEMILTPADLRGSRAGQVVSVFATLDELVAQDVARAEGTDALGRAAQGQALARMRAAFDLMARNISSAQDATLDSFGQVFTPLVRDQVDYNRMRREAALAALDGLRQRMMGMALAMAGLVLCVIGLLYLVVLRPLLKRLRLAGAALGQAGGGGLPARLPTAPRDELALLFARLNQLAARLDRRRRAVAVDHARLENTIAVRTAALADANARLSRIDEDRRRFFADVSHELRTPLTVILAEAELASTACQTGQSGQHPAIGAALATIRARATRLNRRIEDLLRIARSDSGQLELDPRPVSLAETADMALEDMRTLLHRAGLRVESPAEGPCPVLADPDWLRQIIGGVIANTVKHARQATVLTIGCGTDGVECWCEIADDGQCDAGAESAGKPMRFDRMPRSGNFGIGLALARWVTEAQGGRLTLRSPAAAGRGFAVRIAIPHAGLHARQEAAE